MSGAPKMKNSQVRSSRSYLLFRLLCFMSCYFLLKEGIVFCRKWMKSFVENKDYLNCQKKITHETGVSFCLKINRLANIYG